VGSWHTPYLAFKFSVGNPDPGRFSMPFGQQAITSQMGLLAREVTDLAAALQIIAASTHSADRHCEPLGDYRSVKLSGLRIGCFTDDGTFPVSACVRRAVSQATQILERAGATIVPWQPLQVPRAFELCMGIFTADGGDLLAGLLGKDMRDPRIKQLMFLGGRSRFTLSLLATLLRAIGQPTMAQGLAPLRNRDTAHYWRLAEALSDYREAFAQALDTADGGSIDVLLGPATALPAWTHGAGMELLTAGAYTFLYNALGYPAGVVPVTRVRTDEEATRPATRDLVKRAREVDLGSAGLPVAVQIAARPWQEHVALAAMACVQMAARSETEYPHTPC